MVHKRTKPTGAIRTYGVVIGQVKAGQIFMGGNSPHYQIWIHGGGQDFRAAVDARSVDGSEVMALWVPAFTKTSPKLNLAALVAGGGGHTPIATGPHGAGIDFLRDNLFDVSAMIAIPPEGGGVSLTNLLDAQVKRAKADAGARAIVFGEFFHDPGKDQTFGFSPEQGVHDIHMMQGNSGSFANDNRVHGDGALFFRFGDGETSALFVRFHTQATRTDNNTGAPVH